MSELPNFGRMLMRAPTADRIVLVVTFLLTVFVDLVVAVNVGVMLAIFHFLRRMAASVETREVAEDALEREFADQVGHKRPEGVMVYEIDGPMFLRQSRVLNVHSNILRRILSLLSFACVACLLSMRQACSLSRRSSLTCINAACRCYCAKPTQKCWKKCVDPAW